MNEHSRRHKRSSDADERNLNLHILPRWRTRQIEDVRRADIITLAEELIADGKPVLANRVQALISSIFTFAVDAELVENNPAARLKKRGEEGCGTRVLSDPELRLFWARSVLTPISRPTGLALRLQLVTGARPSEAAEPQLNEFCDLDDVRHAHWIIPAERAKNGRALVMPLSDMALEAVRAAADAIGKEDTFLFPSRVDRKRSLDGHALATAMRRLAESEKLTGPGSNSWKAEPPTPHDLRRTFATRLSSLGVPKQDRDALMNHTPQDVGSRHYDMYSRLAEKRAAVDLWSSRLRELLAA